MQDPRSPNVRRAAPRRCGRFGGVDLQHACHFASTRLSIADHRVRERAGTSMLAWILLLIYIMKIRSFMLFGAVFASTLPFTAVRAQPYATVDVGYASADFSLGSPYNGSVDDRSVMFGVDAGIGFREHLAIEIAGRWYGDFDGRGTPCAAGAVCSGIVESLSGTDLSIYKISLVPHAVVGRAELFGEAGYYHMRIDVDLGTPDDKFTQNGLVLGAGIRWYFSEPWSISIRAARYDSNLYELGVGVGWGLRSAVDRGREGNRSRRAP